METTKERFNYRAFVAIMIGMCAIILPISGLALHAYSEGIFAAGKHSWFTIHILSGIFFLIFFVWHAILNRRALLKHIKSGVSKLLPLSREARLSFIIMAVIIILIVFHSFRDIS